MTRALHGRQRFRITPRSLRTAARHAAIPVRSRRASRVAILAMGASLTMMGAASGGCSLLVDRSLSDKPEGSAAEATASTGAAGGGDGGSGASSTGTAGGDGPSTCEGSCEAASCCDDQCVDLATNHDHCGVCGNNCLAGRLCKGATCVPSWTVMSTVGAPAPRERAAAVWINGEGGPTKSGMFVWGGRGEAGDLADGGIYDPASDTWKPVSADGAPSPRVLSSAVWTGSRVVVLGGGASESEDGLTDGGQYDPVTGKWTAVSAPPVPVGRRLPIVVWTGSRVLVWGGEDKGTPVVGGAFYDPTSDAWSDVAMSGAPSERSGVAWAWTGAKLLLFGGRINKNGAVAEGYAYSVANNQWSMLGTTGAPSPRYDAFAVWMNGELLIWGGQDGAGKDLDTGARYEVATDQWLPVKETGAPQDRSAPAGRTGWTGFTGSRALLAGGLAGNSPRVDGRQYDPALDEWTATIPGWPMGQEHEGGAGLWTGQELILWSGMHNGALIDRGDRYKP